MQPCLRAFAVALCLVGAPAAGRAQQPGQDEQRILREYLEVLHLAHEHSGTGVSYRDLVDSGIKGMLRTLDPHTSFLAPESFDSMRERQQASFFGLGILVSQRNGRLTVISPIEGTPAHRLGMRSGDVIQAIEGEPTHLLTLDEAISKLKGPKGTEVRITVVRPGLEEPFDLMVTRAEIPQNTVRYAYMMTPEIGYVRLSDFSRSTGREMTEVIERLRDEGMQRLLLDLRGNGGGLLDQGILVADLFLPEGSTIVSLGSRFENAEYRDTEDEPDPELALPLVVLVNRGTASAAEIVAGAIQDHDAGLIVGTPTWGKGLVQTVYNLRYGYGIALTTARYHTPSGRVIQRDYTSYYDYYSESEAADGETERAIAPAQPEFLTDLGRTVYGGGGISPDVVVELPDGPMVLQALYRYNTFFEFAIDHKRRHPEPPSDWSPGDELVDEFVAWLDTRDLPLEGIEEGLQDPDARDVVRRRLHSDVFNAAFGSEAAHRIEAAGDHQIQAGLAQFDRAAEMLARRRQRGVVVEPEVSPETTLPLNPPLDGPPPGAPPDGPPADGPRSPLLTVPAPLPEHWPAELRAAERFVSAKLLQDAAAVEEAAAAYRESIALDASDPYTLAEFASFLSDLALRADTDEQRVVDLEAAAREAEKALALAPDDSAILSTFAQISLRLAELRPAAIAQAREAYESLRQKTTGDLQVLTSLGQIYLMQQQPQLAAEVIAEAMRWPGHSSAVWEVLESEVAFGNIEAVAETLLELAAGRPTDTAPLLSHMLEYVGDAYVWVQEPGKARAIYLRVLEMSDTENLEAVRRKLEALEE